MMFIFLVAVLVVEVVLVVKVALSTLWLKRISVCWKILSSTTTPKSRKCPRTLLIWSDPDPRYCELIWFVSLWDWIDLGRTLCYPLFILLRSLGIHPLWFYRFSSVGTAKDQFSVLFLSSTSTFASSSSSSSFWLFCAIVKKVKASAKWTNTYFSASACFIEYHLIHQLVASAVSW